MSMIDLIGFQSW